jgi:tRNA A-37 threonylcarbamoyl transferase component Bud32
MQQGAGDGVSAGMGGAGAAGSKGGSTQITAPDSGGDPDASGGDPRAVAGGKSKGGTNVDTIIGKIVVDQGLATSEEVQHCIEQVRSLASDNNQRSLAELLVRNEYITGRQLLRVRQMAEAERQGQAIPGYKVLGKLGAGAMAAVYKARQLSLDRLVAIKVLPEKFSKNAQFIARFYDEGRAAAQLNHPNIVQAYDVGQAGKFHYFVMEFVDGRTVYDDIVKNKRYDENGAIDIVLQIAEALQHAHSRGLIHRDVKPKNVMLTKDGVAKLADMGLARAMSDKEAAEAEQGKAFGTPYYISPEQIRGEMNIGPPADIYSLGATLYHMVVGRVPFDGKNPSAVMHQHLKGELVAPDHVNARLSAGISEVIEMMMAKNSRERYQSCADLMEDLKDVRAGRKPRIAHKDIGGAELAAIAQAEAQAATELSHDQGATQKRQAVSDALWVVMCVLLVLSGAVNVYFIFIKGG